MLKTAVRSIQHWSKRFVTGARFRLYTKPNAAASPGPRVRLALCYLIPSLGDVVMLFPLLDALHREQPTAEVTAFVSGSGKILAEHPAITRIYERPPRNGLSRHLWPLADIGSLWLWWRRQLRNERFDLCVVPRGGVDPFYSAHLAWLLGGGRRVGYTSSVEPERAGSDLNPSPLLTDEVTQMNGLHEIERGAEVLKLAGLLSRRVDFDRPSPALLRIAQSAEAQRFIRSFPQLAKPYFVISPGASVRYREWPLESYAAVAQHFTARNWLPVIVGGSEVRPSGDRIAAQISAPVLNLAGQTSFAHLAAVLAGARCFFGNDSGTGHLAGALGAPAVIISSYALSSPPSHQISPQRTRPSGPWQAVLQPEHPLAPCGIECTFDRPHCITQIQVSSVLSAVEDLLDRRESAPEVASVAR